MNQINQSNPMFAKFDQVLGTKTPTTIQDTSKQSRADEIRALAVKKTETPAPDEPSLGSKLMGRLGDIGSAIGDVVTLKTSLPEGALRAAGSVAGGVGDVIGKVAEPITHPIMEALSQTDVGKAIAPKISDVASKYSEWAKNNPQIAKDLEAATNIATLLPIGKGASMLGEQALKTEAGLAAKTAVSKVVSSSATETAEKELSKLAELVSETPTKKTGISALEKTGGEESLTGGYKLPSTASDLRMAENVKGVVNPKSSMTSNIKAINKEIARVSEKEVRPGLKGVASDPIESTVNRLKNIEKPDIVVADTTLDRTYDLVRNRMIQQIEKQPPTLEGLLNARQDFDKMVIDQFGDVAFDSEKNTAIKRAVKDMRGEVNAMIAEKAPQYSKQMEKLTDMYDARYNIAEKVYTDLNKGGYARLKSLYPKATKTAEITAGAAGLGLTGAYIKGLMGQ